ncbi:transglutaminase [Aquimarina rhabdastrellae]
MKSLSRLLVVIISIIITNSYAQEYKFGKVSKEELTEKVYAKDSSANATILYEEKIVKLEYSQSEGFVLVTDVFKRIKLYNKDGFDHATHQVLLYERGGDEEVLSGLKGVTYNFDGGKIEKSKLKKDGIFKNQHSKNRKSVKFTMPALKDGSVIEYKYSINSPYIQNIDKIYLQYDIPIKKLLVETHFPEYFTYKKRMSGGVPIDLKSTSYGDKIDFVNKQRTGFYASKTTFDRSSVDFNIKKDKIEALDVVAFREEPFAGNMRNYISSLNYELSFVKFPNQTPKFYTTTWEDVAKTIFERPSFGGELKKDSYYKNDLDQIVNATESEQAKVAKVFSYVKSRMNWNEYYGVYTDVGVKKAYKEQVGNVAEINLMLTSMLQNKGIDADPVLVSSSNKAISLFPTLDGFNYVITRVRLSDGKVLYLDATDKYGMPNILPNRILFGMGRVITKHGGSEMVSLRPKRVSSNRVSIQAELTADGNIKGKESKSYLGYLARGYRASNANIKEEERIKKIQEKDGLNEIAGYTRKGVKEYGKGVNERFDFTLEDQTELIGEELFFSPLLFLKTEENPFKSKERLYPVDFGYGFSNAYMVNVKIPEGYEVASLPASKALKLPENMGSFSYRINEMNGVIQVVVSETVKSPIIPSDYYPTLKEFYKQVVEKENEQVVLKKIK